ncbi:CPBP family intramembrane glutamic endopeptidase [Lignipirellula cremea]|uniref:CAAX amino terminal protease self-immunity n=1 Tax=Lignipirellula cremea TaxID=2528010 RepID=A0A518E2G9_9BACT|nr:CPBP family intramembrane glutamic endopeptidase [Lignipirellula cremea]QDU98264.1 CAAX amino terminal protease self- immunity [Lignipirellula cremea]
MQTDLVTIGAACLVTLSLLYWGRGASRLMRGQPLLPFEPSAAAPWGLMDLLFAMLAMLILQSLAQAGVLWSLGIPLETKPSNYTTQTLTWMIGAGGIANLAAVGLAACWMWLRSGARLYEFGLSSKKLSYDLAIGAAGFAMLAVPVYGMQAILSQWFTPHHPLIDRLEANPTAELFWASGLAAVIAAPIAEEFFFRLILQGWLERAATGVSIQELIFGGRVADVTSPGKVAPSNAEDTLQQPAEKTLIPQEENPYASPQPAEDGASNQDEDQLGVLRPMSAEEAAAWRPRGAYWPILTSAFLFAGMHWGHGPAPIPLFFLAIGLGYLYQQTHRIVPCILVHFLLNATTFCVLLSQTQ